MPSVWRIGDRRSFARLRAEGRRGRSGPVSVLALALPDGPPRVAYSIGRPAGPAVVRNRLRRRLRALVAEAELASGAYLVSAGAAATGLSADELRHHLAAATSAALERHDTEQGLR